MVQCMASYFEDPDEGIVCKSGDGPKALVVEAGSKADVWIIQLLDFNRCRLQIMDSCKGLKVIGQICHKVSEDAPPVVMGEEESLVFADEWSPDNTGGGMPCMTHKRRQCVVPMKTNPGHCGLRTALGPLPVTGSFTVRFACHNLSALFQAFVMLQQCSPCPKFGGKVILISTQSGINDICEFEPANSEGNFDSCQSIDFETLSTFDADEMQGMTHVFEDLEGKGKWLHFQS